METLYDLIKSCEKRIEFFNSKLDKEKNNRRIDIIKGKILDARVAKYEYEIILNTIKLELQKE